jgi:hypothetical protein
VFVVKRTLKWMVLLAVGVLTAQPVTATERPPAHEERAIALPHSLGLSAELGFVKRVDTPPQYELTAPFGPSVGLGVEAPFGDRLSVGLSYEFRGLGRERSPIFSSGVANVSRAAHALWLAMRVFPVRGEIGAVFMGLRVAPVWQNATLVASTWDPRDAGRAVGLSCSASGTAALGLGAELGGEVRLGSSVRLTSAAGFASLGFSDDVIDRCVPGAGSVLSLGMRTGLVFDIDFAP